MNVLIVYAHPSRDSFNGALLDAITDEVISQGHTVEVSDLYGDKFNAVGGPNDFIELDDAKGFHYQTEQNNAAVNGNFVPEIVREQEKLRRADVLIFQFPIWWGGEPAILKGWFDRIAAYGVTYADGVRFETGLFKGRRSLVSVTTGGTPHRFSDDGYYGDINKVLWPVQQLFLGYLGFELNEPQVAYAVARMDEGSRKASIEALRKRVRDVVNQPCEHKEIPSTEELLKAVGNRDWRYKG